MFAPLSMFILVLASLTTVRGLALPDAPVHELAKRVVYNCTDSTKLAAITAAYTEGKVMAADARNYIASHGASDPLVKLYFGNDTSLIPRVSWTYNQIANEAGTNYTMVCDWDPSGLCASNSNQNAYNRRFWNTCTVNGVSTECNWRSQAVFCPLWYDRPVMSCSVDINSRFGSREDVMVHEMSHALGITHDHDGIKSCSSSRTLALNNATAAVDNAQAYGCFVMEVYKTTRC
ncbi:hypothetical protein VNI00_011685 [Paramarasmius palmivorus]|uniref:Putative peptidase domain-containing protein n=1 Tax=Paramarasmius palmivorus TaxID=297713 RepID=A0AAW0CEE1_9AGAR